MNARPRVTVLAGGVGAARFLRGLVRVVEPSDVTVIGNVGDDLSVHGLRVCPDLDSVAYHLADVHDEGRGWGRAGETTTVLEELGRFDEHAGWFTLGDRDIALHLHRTRRLAAGATLSEVTAEVTAAFGVGVRLLPVTDDEVATTITTADGRRLHFQGWWVGERGVPDVAGVDLAGAEEAKPAPGVVEAIEDADVVLVAPSNPVVSIGTILAVPGIAGAVATTTAPVVGVSPIIGGAPVRGMADRLLPAIGVDVDAAAVARHYAPWLDGWVLDDADAAAAEGLRADGLAVAVCDTMLDDPARAARVAQHAMALAQGARS